MLEVLLEEPSAESVLRILIPRIIPGATEHVHFEMRVFSGKDDLLRKLPQRLRGYSAWAASADVRILTLLDRDDDDCAALKKRLDLLALDAGLAVHKSGTQAGGGEFKARIACEEIEAWYLGDPNALKTAYPKIARNFESRKGFRDVDSIKGGTWERLEKLLQDAGYFSNGLRKLEIARTMAPLLNLENSGSPSFMSFCQAVRECFPEIDV